MYAGHGPFCKPYPITVTRHQITILPHCLLVPTKRYIPLGMQSLGRYAWTSITLNETGVPVEIGVLKDGFVQMS